MLCGTNGLTRFDVIAPIESLPAFNPVDAKDSWIDSHGASMEYDLNSDGKLDQLDYSIAEVGFRFRLKRFNFGFIELHLLAFWNLPSLSVDS